MQGATTSDATEATAAQRPAGSGFLADRWLDRAPIAPPGVAVAIAVTVLAAFLLLAWWAGGVDKVRSSDAGIWTHRELRLAVLIAMLCGYLPVARRYVSRSAARIRDELDPWIESSAEDTKSFLRLDPAAARRAGLWGLSIVPVTALVVDRDPGLYFREGYWVPEVVFAWVVGAFVGFWLGSFVYVTLAYAQRFSRLADALRPIDLLDLSSTSAFARHGLSSALLWLVMLSLITLNVVDVAWFVVTGTIAVVIGVAALVLPVRGVHLRLREAKSRELARVDAAIRGDAAALSGSPIANRGASPSLSDLLAWRGHVESVREWPFDTITIVRFGLYLAIPLGSWLGGAFVERLLGAALD